MKTVIILEYGLYFTPWKGDLRAFDTKFQSGRLVPSKNSLSTISLICERLGLSAIERDLTEDYA